MASTARLVSAWMASIFRLMSSVALAVSLASSLTSLATTANPLPASPARAASMVAFRASRLVCWAIEVMTLMTLPISALDSPSLATVALAAVRRLYCFAGDLGRLAGVLGNLWMVELISSAPVATLFRLVVTCWVAARPFACAEVSSALLLICWLVDSQLLRGMESAWEFCAIDFMLACKVSAILLVATSTPQGASMQAFRLFLMVLKSPL